MQVLLQLLTPLRYLRVTRGPKLVVDIVLPLIAGALLTGIISEIPNGFKIIGSDGLVAGVNSALQVLVGFYVAALAAVSTFNSVSLDQPLADRMMLREGRFAPRQVTRREMLSYLFGYLSLLSFTLLLIGLFASPVRFVFDALIPAAAAGYAKIFFIGVYITLVWALFFTTLLGLYYLVHRIHRADPQLLTGAGVRKTPNDAGNNVGTPQRRNVSG